MNINLRAMIFGIAAATTMTLTFDALGAARDRERQIVRLDRVTVIAHHQTFDVDGNLKVIRLDPITVLAHKDQE